MLTGISQPWLRHYEIAAAGCLPCVRNLESKNPFCAPHGLQDGLNCVSYHNWPNLKQKLVSLESNPAIYQRMLRASREWILNQTTLSAAKRLLDAALLR